ncbi:MAG: hypothetical protein HJJLKODD_00463 [Phycisphaerae bacterium]|nr:hypothetical protein [Phycisphaerae bacterium]
MIIDVYTHVWDSPSQLGKSLDMLRHHRARRSGLGLASESPAERAAREIFPPAATPLHLQACRPADRAIVLGFRSHYLDAHISNDFVAEYVQQYPEKLIGFAGVDPTRPDEARDEVMRSQKELGFKGVTIAPAAQDLHPASSNAYKIYELVDRLHLPLLIHQGVYFASSSKLEYARPVLLDEVARNFPNLKILIAHLGYPWIDETIVLLEKHANIYADVSGLLAQTWLCYNALIRAYEYGVMDKLLFGSGFPFGSTIEAIETLYSINQICQGTNLPMIPREQLRNIIERPTLNLLGIEDHNNRPSNINSLFITEDETS